MRKILIFLALFLSLPAFADDPDPVALLQANLMAAPPVLSGTIVSAFSYHDVCNKDICFVDGFVWMIQDAKTQQVGPCWPVDYPTWTRQKPGDTIYANMNVCKAVVPEVVPAGKDGAL